MALGVTVNTATGSPAARATVADLVGVVTLVAAAWAVTVGLALAMGNGPGTMGLGPFGFLGIWAATMTAMMGPSAVTVAASARRAPAVVTAIWPCGQWSAWWDLPPPWPRSTSRSTSRSTTHLWPRPLPSASSSSAGATS
jgi:hypothetical protein